MVKVLYARAELLFCPLDLLFYHGLVAVAVVVCLRPLLSAMHIDGGFSLIRKGVILRRMWTLPDEHFFNRVHNCPEFSILTGFLLNYEWTLRCSWLAQSTRGSSNIFNYDTRHLTTVFA